MCESNQNEFSNTIDVEEFDQFVGLDEDDTTTTTPRQSVNEIEVPDRNYRMVTCKSMPEIAVFNANGSGLKPILKQSKFSIPKRSCHSNMNLPFLNSISQEGILDIKDQSTSSNSTAETLMSTDSNEGAMIRNISSPAIPLVLRAQSNVNTPHLNRVSSMPEMSRRVSFESVQVREYEVTCVDNPACRTGPPIGLSWNYQQLDVRDLIDYESERNNNRRTPKQMLMPKSYRKKILKGHCQDEIKQVKREVKKIRSSRVKTHVFGEMLEVKEALENAGKSLKKKIWKGKNSDEKISASSHF